MVAVPQCTIVNELHYIFVIASFASRLLGDVLRHCSFRSKVGRVTEWGLNMAPRREFSDFTRALPSPANMICRAGNI